MAATTEQRVQDLLKLNRIAAKAREAKLKKLTDEAALARGRQDEQYQQPQQQVQTTDDVAFSVPDPFFPLIGDVGQVHPGHITYSPAADTPEARAVLDKDSEYMTIPDIPADLSDVQALVEVEKRAEEYRSKKAAGEVLTSFEEEVIERFPKTSLKDRIPLLDNMPWGLGMKLYMPLQGALIQGPANVVGNITDIILDMTESQAAEDYKNNPGVQLLNQLDQTDPAVAAQLRTLLPQFNPNNTDTVYLDPDADYRKLFGAVMANPTSAFTGIGLPNAWYAIKPIPKGTPEEPNAFFFNRDFWESVRDSARELSTPGGRQVLGQDIVYSPRGLTEAILNIGGQVAAPGGAVFKALSKVPKLGKSPLARGAVGGFVVDGLAFEPGNNMMNLLEDAGIDGSFIKWFKAKETDTESEKLFKTALEGAVLGGTIETAFGVMRAWKKGHLDYVAERDELMRRSIESNLDLRTAQEIKRRRSTDKTLESLDKSTGIGALLEERNVLAEKAQRIKDPILRAKVVKQITQAENLPSAVARLRQKAAVGRFGPEQPTDESIMKKYGADKRRISAELVEGIHSGDIDISFIEGVIKKYNISPEELAEDLLEAASQAGRTLGYLSALSKKVNDIFPNLPPELKQKFADAAAKDKRPLVSRVWRTIEDTRRGFLISQLATATRNMASATGRMGISMAFDENLQSLVRATIKTPGSKNMWRTFSDEFKGNLSMFNALSSTFRSSWAAAKKKRGMDWVPGTDRTKQELALIDELMGLTGSDLSKDAVKGQHILRMISPSVNESILGGRIANITNWINRPQEILMRRFSFEYKARQLATRRGVDLQDISADDIKQAADFALDMTFAANAKSDWARNFIDIWRNSPLSIVNPFPRFMFANALPFMYEHSPLGFIQLLTKGDFARGGLTAVKANSDEFAKIVSRAGLGTAAMWAAWNYRDSPFAGEKWYEINTPKGLVDIRSYSPLASSFLFADATQKFMRGQMGWPDIKELAAEGAGLSRPAGTALPFTRMIMSQEFSEQYLQAMIGQYLGSFFTPLRMAKDFGASEIMNPMFEGSPFTTDAHVVRDMRTEWESILGDEARSDLVENVGRGESDSLYGSRLGAYFKPIAAAMPGVETTLPAATTPFMGRENVQFQDLQANRDFKFYEMKTAHNIMEGIVRQVSGVSFRPKGAFEREFDRLQMRRGDVYSKTGNKTADRVINGYVGQIIHSFVVPRLSDPRYLALTKPWKKYYLKKYIASARKAATKLANTRIPVEMYEAKLDRKMDSYTEEVMRETGVLPSR